MNIRLSLFGTAISVLVIAAFVLVFNYISDYVDSTPSEIEGIWYHHNLNCMCGPYSVIIFKDGKAFRYSSVHKECGIIGSYKKLTAGRYELTEEVLLKQGTDSHAEFEKMLEEKKREFNDLVIHPDGNISYKTTTILTPYKKYMPYSIEGFYFKLKRVTGDILFERIYNEWKQKNPNEN